MNKIRLSVVIITFNEEKNIARCLEAALKVADEIIVVDSYSTDKTKSICLTYGVKFIEHQFEGYVKQKNFANSQASSPYILNLDADEVLSEELISSILKVKENWTCDGYLINRITNYCGKWIKHGGWYPDKKLRLYDVRKGKWEGENLHEKFVLEKNSLLGQIKGDLYHYSYISIKQHIEQINKFTEIAAQTEAKLGRKITLLKLIMYPIWKFKRDYFIRLGFLDGYYGFIVAILSAFASFVKYAKIRQYTNDKI
ncbi:MAG: glycosyltransferase family 2 protein [Bacteroidales bacterium]|nr:glycosyltransferase family 2 protein [Bacteroidales bacterium]